MESGDEKESGSGAACRAASGRAANAIAEDAAGIGGNAAEGGEAE